jgi:hypothetical protein
MMKNSSTDIYDIDSKHNVRSIESINPPQFSPVLSFFVHFLLVILQYSLGMRLLQEHITGAGLFFKISF